MKTRFFVNCSKCTRPKEITKEVIKTVEVTKPGTIDVQRVVEYVDTVISELDYKQKSKKYMIEQLEKVKTFVQQ